MSGLHAADFYSEARQVALCNALSDGDAEGVRAALGDGADPNAEGAFEMRPLFFAASEGAPSECVSALLEAGADPNTITSEGLSVMGLATLMEDPSYLRLLLQHGGDPNLMNNSAPLPITAVYAQRFDNMRALLEAGADVNAAPGDSLLMTLVGLRRWNQAREVLSRGADAFFRSSTGATIAYQTQERGNRLEPEERQEYGAFRGDLEAKGVHFPAESPADWRARLASQAGTGDANAP